jgi:small basic protein
MIFLLLAFFLGVLFGVFLPIHLDPVLAKYVSVAVLAGFDSILGGAKSVYENRFSIGLFVSGYFSNMFLASLLTYIGDRLGVELYLAAIVTFGVRIFQDLSILRVYWFERTFGKNFSQHPQGVQSK